MFYANLTPEEQSFLEAVEGEVAHLIQINYGNECRPTWIGDDNQESRLIRLVASDRVPCAIFEIAASDLLDITPALLFWVMTRAILRTERRDLTQIQMI
jgi:hypothetical protein